MIIKKITVENWRSLKNPVTIEFCGGVNVICGDNGRGKSTVMEALRMGFFDRHGTTAADIKRIKPWGCELNPTVTIEFCAGGNEYRLTKRFIGQKCCLVEQKDPSTNEYVRHSEADKADDYLRGLMGGDAARGVSDPSNWGLAGLLWIPQGGGDYNTLNGTLAKRITEKRSVDREQARTGGVENAAKSEYSEYYTDNGKPSHRSNTRGARLKELERSIAEKRGELAKKQLQLSNMESLRADITQGKRQISDSDTLIENICREIREAEDKLGEYNGIKAEYAKIEPRLNELKSREQLLKRNGDDLEKARQNIERHKRSVTSLVRDIEAAEAQLKRDEEQITAKLAEKDTVGSMVKLEFTAETEIVWEPAGGDPFTKRTVSKGETVSIEGLGRVSARLPGIGAITVSGPINDNAAAIRERVNTLRRMINTQRTNIDRYRRDIEIHEKSILNDEKTIAVILTGGKTEEGMRRELSDTQGEMSNINKVVEKLRDQIRALNVGGDPEKFIAAKKCQAGELRGKQAKARQQLDENTGRLKELGGIGLHEDIGLIEEELDKLEKRFHAETIRMKSLKLIWETMVAVRREFQEKVTAPVEARASELFSIVNDNRTGTVRLSDDFTIAGFAPDAQPTAAADDLSGGEREQLYFCTRLALAERIIGGDDAEKYPLILDDFLTATDETRLSKIIELLISFADKYQYLIFTCHKERYAAISGIDTRTTEL